MHARATDECCQNALKSDFSYKVFVFRSMGNELVPLPHNIRNGSYIRHNRLSVYQLYVIFIHVLFKTMFSLISIPHSRSKNWRKNVSNVRGNSNVYTTARVFVLRIRVSCAFQTHCTCVEFKLRIKRESTYFETHEYSLAAL